jgi:hypothetical protein
VTSTGPLGEMSVRPPQVEFSEIKLGPRFSGEPNGPSRLDWSVFSAIPHAEIKADGPQGGIGQPTWILAEFVRGFSALLFLSVSTLARRC